ncbi:MAG: nucleobase:cation symporter-2 family protein [Bradymonadales bacterium]
MSAADFLAASLERELNKKDNEYNEALFKLSGRPPFLTALPLALQHVVAMIVGCITPALILANTANLSVPDQVILVQGALFIAAISTMIQLVHFGGIVGSGLPVIMGVSFAYLPSMVAIVYGYDIATIFGAQVVGGGIAFVFGFFVRKIRFLFPPLITGTVVFTIGLSLYPTAIHYMAGGQNTPDYGSWQNWLVAIFTLLVVTILNHFSKGIWKLASILIGMAVGYVFSSFFGMISFGRVAEAGYFSLPQPLYFGINFELSAVIALGLLFGISAIQAIGDFSATTIGGLEREPTDRELRGGIATYGITNIFGAFFGGLPTATYSQNVGIIATTKVVSRFVIGIAATILLIAGIVPKFSAILTTIPSAVLGGATISVFASIAMTGMKLVTSAPMSYRNTSIVGLAAALGVGIASASESLSAFPGWVTIIFGKSPVVLATLLAILLNLILPKDPDPVAAVGRDVLSDETD